MSTVIESSDGWRSWAVAPVVRWRSVNGLIVAERNGVLLELAPSSAQRARAERVAKALGPGLSRVLEQLAGNTPAAAFYLRALLAIACVEACESLSLPCLGDCRKDGVVVPCGSAGADAPRSAGYYQITRATAPATGVTFGELQRDADANHRAAYTLAKSLEDRHALDLPTLAVLWNAGSVRPDASNAWGVHTWSPDLVSRYVRYFNALGALALAGGARSSLGGGLLVGGLLALLFSCASSSASDRDARAAAEQMQTLTREVCAVVLAQQPNNVDVRRMCLATDIAGVILPRLAPSSSASSSSSSSAPPAACSATTGGTCPAP